MGRPGVMLYFDISEAMGKLTLEQRGAIFNAILRYGEFGEVPEFEDFVLSFAWSVVRPRIDKDRETYEKRKARRRKTAEEEPCTNWSDQNVQDDLVPQHNATQHNTNQTNTNTNHIIPTQSKPEGDGAAVLPVYKSFVPPSLQEVRDYCLAQKLIVDPQQFVDYYTANGWRMGKTKMADWKAALRSWNKQRKDENYGKSNSNGKGYFASLGPIGTAV